MSASSAKDLLPTICPSEVMDEALTPDSYEETIGNAILLGGDTDTIAAMAGAISGASLGHTAIPNHLFENLEDREQGKTYIETLASKLCTAHAKISKVE